MLVPLYAAMMMTPLTLCGDGPLFDRVPVIENNVVIRIDTSHQDRPISRRLFGKFTEHLHRNIYHGMWAQILRNPSFEDWPLFFSNDDQWRQHRRQAVDSGQPWPEGLAAHWLPEGEGETTYDLSPDCINTSASQHVRILSETGAGIRQEQIYLPLHRESKYQLSTHVRAKDVSYLTVTIRNGEQPLTRINISHLSPTWKKHTATFEIDTAVRKAAPLTITVTANGPGEFWMDQLLLVPADNIHGFDCDVVRMSRDAKLPLLRYPGGNFVSGYHWRDGIGPVDNRPMRRNPAWACPEYNHVGTDEFMAFCEAVDCDPMICVNAGDGTPEEAAQWVEYCNGSVETGLGALRAAHGHPAPYHVRYWEIGNELYGNWQVGHCDAEEYAERYCRFVHAMRQVDPALQFIANGRDAKWHAPLLNRHAELVRAFSLHPLIGLSIPHDADPTSVFLAFMAYPDGYAGHLRELADQMKNAGVPSPKLAITELQIFTNRRQLPNNNTLSEALYMARYYHMAIRLQGLVELITHSAMVNHGGGLRKQAGVVFAEPSWWATHLYGTLSGTIPVAIETKSPTFDVVQEGMPAAQRIPYVDAVALMDPNRSVLTAILINAHPSNALPASILVEDWESLTLVRGRQIRGATFMTANTTDDPHAVEIRPLSGAVTTTNGRIEYILPPHSITEMVLNSSL